eukprot:3362159-Rhodomonas_salina.1
MLFPSMRSSFYLPPTPCTSFLHALQQIDGGETNLWDFVAGHRVGDKHAGAVIVDAPRAQQTQVARAHAQLACP